MTGSPGHPASQRNQLCRESGSKHQPILNTDEPALCFSRKLAATASSGLQLKKTGVVSAVGMARPAVWWRVTSATPGGQVSAGPEGCGGYRSTNTHFIFQLLCPNANGGKAFCMSPLQCRVLCMSLLWCRVLCVSPFRCRVLLVLLFVPPSQPWASLSRNRGRFADLLS